ncbi:MULTISPECIES: HAMP domain-containing sensor histidine kinase [unclassified Thermoactinomyces]|uniref:sensor histidine kinase n=1 Tax=unclassified Thermoactinomyces TaxID=2634588 RepID=UPI0018DE5D2F|nr:MULTISPECIES: HAMP domain-containing sensor histidine kinase [unclassified Thermoactinomyces]MBH8597708.1 HAMP domain-containing protein [Thermoactinomyces sp. CICC 10523]MBH8604048.1 HAMP domain-containing protein [Thermoactinomyces sp. CICC 10522]MBH8606417.1 HAMP domain-containing protein [Thermoactinomyces sp. CICC 10521]
MNRKLRDGLRTIFAFDSLKIQLLSRSLLVLAGLLMLIGLFQYVFMQGVIYKNKATSMQSQILAIPRFAWEQLVTNPGSLDINPGDDLHRPYFLIPDVSLAFVDMQGNFQFVSISPESAAPPKLAAEQYLDALRNDPEADYQVTAGPDGVEQLLVLQPIVSHDRVLGVVQASTPTGPLKELLIRQLFTFLSLSLAAMLVGLLGFMPVLKRTLVPLFNMVNIAEQIDAGNLAKRFPARQGQMEIDRLAESFNGMLERLEASFAAERETKEQMRRFIADASHELRTPLTSIHGFLEVLLRGAANNPEQLDKALKSMHSESARLNKLVHDLLLLAKLDRTPHMELAEGCLDAMLREMEPQLHILAGNRSLCLSVEPDQKCKYDADKMKQVILNLFQNAVQHTDPETGHIQISLSGEKNGVKLSVRDNGPGIDEQHLPHVFDRFYRIDTSRARKHGGAGLGLSITKSIVDAHGGTIHVDSKVGEGSTFTVWLPKR